jgi:hypothetical protein
MTTPSTLAESTVMVVWPTIGATRAGRLVGRIVGIEPRWDRFRLLRKLLAIAAIPLALAVFAWQLCPFVCRRYRLSSRRLAIQKGLQARDERQIALEEFETIDVEVLPGHAWLNAGDLVFKRAGSEVFRLPGVSRPETFQNTCRETRDALLAVRQVIAAQSG